jgi:glycosyltransferase involved in cell wall biosynthesis
VNILYISTWYPFPADNGSKQRVSNLIKALSQSHNLFTIAFQPESESEKGRIPEITRSGPVWGVHEDPFRYVRMPSFVNYLSPIPLSGWPSKTMRHAVYSIAAQDQWDAVIAFQIPAAQYALLPPADVRIFDIDASLSYMMAGRVARSKGLLSRMRAKLSLYKTWRHESRLARRFQLCTIVSPLEKEFVQNMVKDSSCRVEVLPNGIDCEHNRPGLARRQPTRLVYNGSLTYSANFDAMKWFLSEIFPRIQRERQEVTLTITGSTANVNLSELMLNEMTQLSGHVADVRIPIAESSVCVVPLRQGSGTRIKILEAMALGTPVVSTSKGAEGLDLVDQEQLLIADDPQAFASSVVSLLSNPVLQERLRTNAREYVELHHNWSDIGEQFVRLVENTVTSAAAGRATSRD